MSERRPRIGRLTGPVVSIVVVTRDGAHHLERLFTGLRDRTNYRHFEVIVVDNGSQDRTPELLAADWGFPLRVIRNEGNSTFSLANNQGIDVAVGDYVLLLNNDVDPINPSWLGCLVDALERPGVVATGPLLVYPERSFPNGQKPAHPDLSIQHAGMYFEWRNGMLRAANVAAGGDPLAPASTAVRRWPGVTAACLLTRKDHLVAVNGFTTGYIYGSEDWDLCLKLRRFGDLVCSGAAALFHHEYGTQQKLTAPITDLNRRDNRQRFIERWGPRLTRQLRLDRLRHRSEWTPNRPTRASVVFGRKQNRYGEVDTLAKIMRSLGWIVSSNTTSESPDPAALQELDVVVLTTPEIDLALYSQHTIKIGWVIDSVDVWEDLAWLDEFRLIAVSNPLDARRLQAATGLDPILLLPVHEGPRAHPSDPVYETDVLVDGGTHESRAQLPRMVSFAPGERVVVAGAGWDNEPRFMRYGRSSIEDSELEKLRANAKLVVVSQRPSASWWRSRVILRALALGSLPVTDSFEISQWMFDGALPVASDRGTFRSIVERFGSDGDARVELVEELAAHAAGAHSIERRAAQLVEAIDDTVARLTVAIKISPHNRQVAPSWGDTHFARQFGRALRRRGLHTMIDILPQWDLPNRQEADIVVHLRGLDPYVPKPGAYNVMWIVSHPDDVTPEECNRFDLVFVASESFAAELSGRVDVPVYPLLQAADPDVFRPGEPDPSLRTDVLFVGNARYPARIAPRWAMETGLPLTIYGANWDNFPEHRFVAERYFPNEELARLYRSADVVLNDHWPDMKHNGFLANRLFDVLSCGGFVVSDEVAGIDTAFDGAVPTYRTRHELAESVEHYRANPEERSRLATRGMLVVRSRHTFDVRASEFLDKVRKHAASIPLSLSNELVWSPRDTTGAAGVHEAEH